MKKYLLLLLVVSLSACGTINPPDTLSPEMRSMMYGDVIYAIAQPRFN